MPFQIHALSPARFAPLFDMSGAELAARRARRLTVETHPGTPCRVSLTDAEVGETVLLLNHQHLPGNGPFAASHAIFVRPGAAQAYPARGIVPPVFQTRLISLRAFDAEDLMIEADVVPGADLADTLVKTLKDPAVAYIHLHFAKPGCFGASVTRS